ncbi:endothelin-converting enzyme 1-like [Dermacentor variabilis]|uniref:endothelin-converting enzyme 1-like n=1 Tax=Dermacentor variabilis TaxID=34621 RepID=UPI003F5BF6AE
MATGSEGTAPSTASTHSGTKRGPQSPAAAASPGERGSRPVAPQKSGDKGALSPLAKLKSSPARKERANSGLVRSPVGASQPASPEHATPSNAPSTKATPPCQTVSNSQSFVGLIISIVLVVVVLIVLKIVWFQYSGSPNVCLTSACDAYSHRLLQSINTSVDPCRDFTRFVCGGWKRSQNLDVWEEQFVGFLDRLDATLKDAEIPLTGQNDEQRAAALYRSCDDVLQGKKDEMAAVKAALRDAGIVWPQHAHGADAVHALVYSSIKLGWDAVLSFDVTTHRGETVDELVVDPGSSFHFLLSRSMREQSPASKCAYFQFLRSLFELRGPKNTSAVTYEQMQTIAEPALGDLSLLYDTWDKPRLPADWFANLSSAGVTEARWLEALHNVSISVRAGLRITTGNPGFLATLSGLWTRIGEDSFHLFVSWCTVQVAALYANRGSILNYYGQSSEKAQVYHRAFCLSRAAVFFRKASFTSYIDSTLQENKVSGAKEIALSVRLAFSRRLSKWFHFDENITVLVNWTSMDTAFRSFEYDKDEHKTSGAKNDVMPDMSDSFVNNWQLSTLVNKPDETKHLEYAICHLMFYVVLWKSRDFQLMPYSLSVLFFDPDLPASINYGTFGSEIVGAISSIFVESYREKRNVSMYLIDCMKLGPSGSEMYTDDNVVHAVGFSALVDAYKETNPSSWAIEGLENYTSLQLLFMTACFSLCSGRIKAKRHECELLAQHVPEFDEAFRCPPRDQRNQSFQCQLL